MRASGPFARGGPGWVKIAIPPRRLRVATASRPREPIIWACLGPSNRPGIPNFSGGVETCPHPQKLLRAAGSSPKGAIRVTSLHAQRLGMDRPTSGDGAVDNSHIMWTDRGRSRVVHRRSGLSTDHVPWSSTARRGARPARTPGIHTTHSPYCCHCFALFSTSTKKKQGAWMVGGNCPAAKTGTRSPG